MFLATFEKTVANILQISYILQTWLNWLCYLHIYNILFIIINHIPPIIERIVAMTDQSNLNQWSWLAAILENVYPMVKLAIARHHCLDFS